MLRIHKVLILLLLIENASAQCNQVDFDLRYSDSLTVNVDTIVMYGICNTPSRMFLDELSASLKEKLTKKSVHLEYKYLGNQFDNTLQKGKFNQISMYIIDRSPSNIKVIQKRDNYHLYNFKNIPTIELTTKQTKISYTDEFTVVVYSDSQVVKRLGELLIHCKDLGKPNAGKKASGVLLSKLNLFKEKE